MAETTLDVRDLGKREAYAQLEAQIDSLLDGMDDEIAAMATISCVLHNGFGHLWTGFYRVVGPTLLRVGPYQGSLGCLEIAFGKGVCGTAAAERRTVVVEDVEKFPGHIACDSASRSESGRTGGRSQRAPPRRPRRRFDAPRPRSTTKTRARSSASSVGSRVGGVVGQRA